MTPEERFSKIEDAIESLIEAQTKHEIYLDRLDKRIDKLTEFQVVLMESQNQTRHAINRLTENVEKLLRLGGPNGQQDS